MTAWTTFEQFKLKQLDGTSVTDFNSDALFMALVTNSNIPDMAVDDFWDDLAATEVSAAGTYTADGDALLSLSCTNSAGTITFDCDDNTWPQDSGSGFTDARHVIIYNDSGTDTTSLLLFALNLGTDKGNVAGDLTIEIDALGVFTLAG